MKHGELHSIGHNVADSLACGCSLLIGFYSLDVFGEAARSEGGAITVDFLNGTILEGEPSPYLLDAVPRFREAVGALCAKQGGSVDEFRELKVRYWSEHVGPRFAVSVEDSRGRRSTAEYGGLPGKRMRIIDKLGRARPRPNGREG